MLFRSAQGRGGNAQGVAAMLNAPARAIAGALDVGAELTGALFAAIDTPKSIVVLIGALARQRSSLPYQGIVPLRMYARFQRSGKIFTHWLIGWHSVG